MRSTYKPEDVTLLLKDISGLVTPLPTSEREKRIQSGTHYSEMLPIEYEPSSEYLDLFWWALGTQGPAVARAVARVCDQIVEERGRDTVLVSLARAGTSTGVLMRHYLQKAYGIDAPHYTISIIRGRGIDDRAVSYILDRHRAQDVQFVDGWTGKGAISGELKKAVQPYDGLSPDLAVLADPTWIATYAGTHADLLIPSSCLNSTVCGLISRTFLREDIIGPEDFHGAAYYGELSAHDLTYTYIQSIESWFGEAAADGFEDEARPASSPIDEVRAIAGHFDIQDVNLVKPGIGEATRVLLRRVPWKLLVYSLEDEENLGHLYALAREKKVEVMEYPLEHYKACGLIRTITDA